jgi:recombination protein RecT
MSVADTNIVHVNEVGNEIQPAKPVPLTVRGLLTGAKMKELQQLAGKAMSAERLIKMFAMAASRSPLILQCTAMSVLDCMTKCAELNLMPGTLGAVYLIPYLNRKTGVYELQFILGYRGMMALARRSGDISTISAEVVRNGDEFEFEHGIETKFRHKPKGIQGASVTHAWALCKFKDGSHQLTVMTREEIEGIKSRSRAGNSGPWVTDPAEMAKKTALRRLCKYLPLEPDVAAAIEGVDRAEFEFDMPATGTGEEGGSGEDQAPSTAPNVAGQAAKLAAQIKQSTVVVEPPAAQEQAAAQGGGSPDPVAPPPAAGEQGSLLPQETRVTNGVRRRGN